MYTSSTTDLLCCFSVKNFRSKYPMDMISNIYHGDWIPVPLELSSSLLQSAASAVAVRRNNNSPVGLGFIFGRVICFVFLYTCVCVYVRFFVFLLEAIGYRQLVMCVNSLCAFEVLTMWLSSS